MVWQFPVLLLYDLLWIFRRLILSNKMTSINPAIARDLGNGSHFCQICQIAVKTKIWKAHSAGRQHRENIQRLKAQAAGGQQHSAAPKRSVDNGVAASVSSEPAAKKLKEDPGPAQTSTPWERERQDVVKEQTRTKTKKPVAAKIIGVPDDFFEVPAHQSSGMSANDKVLEEELAQFEKEVAQIDLEQLQREDDTEAMHEEQRQAVEQDVDEVDDRIEGWKRINELEIKVEERLHERAEKNGRQAEAQSDSDDDFDLPCLTNWRSAKF
uniref:U1-type domain-containing protein n=2 Tax=Steinernema glaseri TaxID=37863 RepID=A0A1I7ZRN7_9BILA